MFMKTDMMRDINALRCNVKTSITKVRGAVTKKHTWRGTKIQFMIVIVVAPSRECGVAMTLPRAGN
jgi:hypothetical protein